MTLVMTVLVIGALFITCFAIPAVAIGRLRALHRSLQKRSSCGAGLMALLSTPFLWAAQRGLRVDRERVAQTVRETVEDLNSKFQESLDAAPQEESRLGRLGHRFSDWCLLVTAVLVALVVTPAVIVLGVLATIYTLIRLSMIDKTARR